MATNVLLINTKSRKGRELKADVVACLAESGIALDVTLEVNRRNTLDDALKKVLQLHPTLLMVCGGDGTVNHVIGKLHDKPMRLAIIPTGTTNNFARSLEIPLDVAGAVGFIQHHTAKTIDVGQVNGKTVSNVMGVGLSALVAKKVKDPMKKRFGRAAYGTVGFFEMFKHKAFEAKIHDVDKDFEVHVLTHQLIIANGRYHDGREIVATNSLDNAQLVLFTIGGKSRWSLLGQMLKYHVTARQDFSQPSYFIGRHVTIELSEPQLAEIDGETLKDRVKTIKATTVKSTLKVHRV